MKQNLLILGFTPDFNAIALKAPYLSIGVAKTPLERSRPEMKQKEAALM
jgi:hypothetical protein